MNTQRYKEYQGPNSQVLLNHITFIDVLRDVYNHQVAEAAKKDDRIADYRVMWYTLSKSRGDVFMEYENATNAAGVARLAQLTNPSRTFARVVVVSFGADDPGPVFIVVKIDHKGGNPKILRLGTGSVAGVGESVSEEHRQVLDTVAPDIDWEDDGSSIQHRLKKARAGVSRKTSTSNRMKSEGVGAEGLVLMNPEGFLSAARKFIITTGLQGKLDGEPRLSNIVIWFMSSALGADMRMETTYCATMGGLKNALRLPAPPGAFGRIVCMQTTEFPAKVEIAAVRIDHKSGLRTCLFVRSNKTEIENEDAVPASLREYVYDVIPAVKWGDEHAAQSAN